MAFVITQTDLPQGLSWKKLIFHTLLWKTLFPFCLFLPLLPLNYHQHTASEQMKKMPKTECNGAGLSIVQDVFLKKSFLDSFFWNLQPTEACMSTSSFVTLPFIIFFLAGRSFFFYNTTYWFPFTPGFYLIILSTSPIKAKIVNNVFSFARLFLVLHWKWQPQKLIINIGCLIIFFHDSMISHNQL